MARVAVSEQDLAIAGAICRAPREDQVDILGENVMEQEEAIEKHSPPRDVKQKNGSSVDLGDLKIKISIELDRRQLLLSELKELKVGSVLPFTTSKPENVRLLANGKAFAVGKLVDLDGAIGVMLTGQI